MVGVDRLTTEVLEGVANREEGRNTGNVLLKKNLCHFYILNFFLLFLRVREVIKNTVKRTPWDHLFISSTTSLTCFNIKFTDGFAQTYAIESVEINRI